MKSKYILFIIVITLIFLLFAGKRNNSKIEKVTVTPTEIVVPPTLDIIVITDTPIPTPTKKPSPTPTITPSRIPVGVLEDLFTKYSRKQSVDREKLKKIALCESGLNPNARFLDYAGLFQFSTSSWITTRKRMNTDTNPTLRYHPEEAIKTAAFKLATEGINAWPNCAK